MTSRGPAWVARAEASALLIGFGMPLVLYRGFIRYDGPFAPFELVLGVLVGAAAFATTRFAIRGSLGRPAPSETRVIAVRAAVLTIVVAIVVLGLAGYLPRAAAT